MNNVWQIRLKFRETTPGDFFHAVSDQLIHGRKRSSTPANGGHIGGVLFKDAATWSPIYHFESVNNIYNLKETI